MADRHDPEYLQKIWDTDPRWKAVERPYCAKDVIALQEEPHEVQSQVAVARRRAEHLWCLLHTEPYINALGALSGNQAMEQVEAGLKVIYLSGWQVAADANLDGEIFPDQSLYSSHSVPVVVEKINHALRRRFLVSNEAERKKANFAPIVADAEAGFGGPRNAYVLMRWMIAAGAAGVHFEDQLASEKKCGHLGGKVLVPTQEFITKLQAARLAADVMDVPTVLIARTDANGAKLMTSDIDERDHRFLTGERTKEGFYRMHGGLEAAIARGLSYAPYADMLWCETSKPDLEEARRFADAIHAKFPGKLLAYNCSPSFNWKKNLADETIAKFQRDLGEMGYKFQFVTLAGFHALNASMFKLAHEYAKEGMPAYVRLQKEEFELEKLGYKAVKHQTFVGTGYFDKVMDTLLGEEAATAALKGSTEEEQFSSPMPQ
ncbi:isocitrate lyase [Candidatus Peribacteria bacterium RIFCSPHIGHO2_02_FULL_49_16]|nr:MAG: isocitrate lyase [Candidatus Peribacteria bacterium RIFCSPHIGHO2_01_FULL_49_38]OGJ59216.1 MAG: isocitrate lyase [Candidatus Peribacteria bacterium RIFCSPHIGHO2_02_FULL_49_16]